jgi:hypothetical protein
MAHVPGQQGYRFAFFLSLEIGLEAVLGGAFHLAGAFLSFIACFSVTSIGVGSLAAADLKVLCVSDVLGSSMLDNETSFACSQ